MSIEITLRENSFFSGLSQQNIKAIAAICTAKNCKKRDVLFLEGQAGVSVFVVQKGSVQLTRISSDGREIVIKTLSPGEIFAEVVLFEFESYPVSATAVTEAVVLVLAKTELTSLLDQNPFRNDFIAMLMQKQRYLTDRIMYLTSRDVEARFFGFVKEQYGQRDVYEIDLSKKDIAGAIGATPETLSRLIQRLTDEGKIHWEKKQLSIQNDIWDELVL